MSKAQKLTQLDKALAIAITAIDRLACWDDGPVVTGKFDDPGSASLARETLAKIQAVLSGRDPDDVRECSICRRYHGTEVTHACE